MKKWITSVCAAAFILTALAGCSGQGGDTQSSGSSTTGTTSTSSFDATKSISVITREQGSGTRDAFIELTGLLEKDEAGNKTDKTAKSAVTLNGTQAVMSNVAGNEYAIGYISLGSLSDTVKAVSVGGVAPSADTVKDGSYVISRPFNIVTKDAVSEAAQDFIDFILSADGQKVIEDNGYIKIADAAAFTSKRPSGKVAVAGSSSVSPVMEKLKEAYEAINSGVTISIQTTDSSSGITAAQDGTCGMNSVIEGICDIGMASRELKDSEKETLSSTQIAMDGIAVIVNKANTITSLTVEQLASIFSGATTTWDKVGSVA